MGSTVEPPNKGQFRSSPLFGGCPLVGGSFKLLFIAISKTYRMYGLYIDPFFLVQEAKELARYKAFFHGLQYASNGSMILSNNINDLYHNYWT